MYYSILRSTKIQVQTLTIDFCKNKRFYRGFFLDNKLKCKANFFQPAHIIAYSEDFPLPFQKNYVSICLATISKIAELQFWPCTISKFPYNCEIIEVSDKIKFTLIYSH